MPAFGTNWRKTVDGYIEQWGTSASAVAGQVTVTFPIPFPSSCESVQLTEISGGAPGSGTISWGVNPNFTKTGFSAVSTNTAVAEPVIWRALGK
ncbi:gp53-like domain-containing protein [Atlantibacter subterraneus]|uniref:gp53-like domain-containing protein n=1 Tax=Atlantibacter subterraneus TaxID=255519 RepID=UPI0035E45A32